MSTFKSTVTINKPASDIYNFLADMNNHQQLMPADISEWTSTVNEASFSIRNMLKLSLKFDKLVPNELIKIIPSEKAPFELDINWQLSPNKNSTEVLLVINAGLNMMMKMVASGPLQKLADEETAKLFGLFNL